MSNAKTEVQADENFGVNVLTSPIVSDPANDPYTVENMSKAMRKQLLAKSANPQEVEQMTLEPNYLYVRFLVEGKEGVAQLKAYDSSLVLFKHPLDYKPIRKPAVYKDPSLPDNVIALFATVPVDYDFGPTKYEVLKELFLVEPLDGEGDDADSTVAAKSLLKKAANVSSASVLSKMEAMGVSLHDVEWESLNMTGNLGERVDDSKVGGKQTMAWSLFGGGKKLGGHLTFQDDQLGEQPLVGVRVTGGYSYYWREAHTDKNGKFKIPEKWTYKIDFEANFDSDEFLLEDGHSVYGEDLEIEHNNYKSDWNEKFTGNKAKWCVVWTAAYQYWYGDNFGLKRPRQNTLTNMSLDIVVYYKNKKDYDKDVDSDCKGTSIGCNETGAFLHDDKISVLAYGHGSKDIYQTTVHEVAHSSQYQNQKKGSYKNLAVIYKESYARGIEIYFAKKRYGGSESSYSGWFYRDYTGIVADLMDATTKTADMKKNIDNVSGFTINQIETAFFNSNSMDAMKAYLKEKYPSGKDGRKYTSSDMDKLFNYWINL